MAHTKLSYKCSVSGFGPNPPLASGWLTRSPLVISMPLTHTHHLPSLLPTAILYGTPKTELQTLGFGPKPASSLALANVQPHHILRAINPHPPHFTHNTKPTPATAPPLPFSFVHTKQHPVFQIHIFASLLPLMRFTLFSKLFPMVFGHS